MPGSLRAIKLLGCMNLTLWEDAAVCKTSTKDVFSSYISRVDFVLTNEILFFSIQVFYLS